MNKTMTLRSYEDWKHCIAQVCGIPLTVPCIEPRLAALRDPAHNTTQRFVATWGEQHRPRVTGWFEQAQQEKGGTSTGSARSGRAS